MNQPLSTVTRVNVLASRAALGAVLALAIILCAPLAASQERSQEISANLDAGRVIFCVTRDAIVVAAVEGGGEAGSRPPAIVPLDQGRIAVVLGANEWINPSSGVQAMRLDTELPRVAANATRRAAVPGSSNANQASSIEDIGVNLLELLRPQVTQIHRKLDLAPDEPLVELLLADYVLDYGPEIWSLQYRVRQEALGSDYWETRPLRPAYVQLYPPEKGQPRTFMEAHYPASSAVPTMITKLQGHDPQIDPISKASGEIAQAMAAILQGDSRKARSGPVADFLRAALPVLAGAKARLAIAKLDPDRGFQWLVAPEEPLPAPAQGGKPQEPGAPSLRGYQQKN